MLTLSDLEIKYKDELQSIEEWVYLRSYYRHALAAYHIKEVRHVSKFKILKDMFFGFFSWFRSYRYFVFSNTSERKLINDKWFDKSVDYLIKVLGKEKGLLVEEPNPNYFKQNDIFTSNVTSRRMLDGIALLIKKLNNKKIMYCILDDINQEYNIDVDYQYQINLFNARYILHTWLFKFYKIDFIIITCYYSRQYVLKSANDLNIQTIEVQHGVITKKNDAYNSLLTLDKSYFPNYLLSFGESEKKELLDNGLISKAVIPIGSFYLDYLKSSFLKNRELESLINKYDKSIGVSLQKGSEKLMLEFIINLATKSKDILYIIIPRFFNVEENKQYIFPENILFYPSLNCYQTIMHCNYHCTFYSACTVEVPSLGIPNILIDFDGTAKKYYEVLENKTTVIVQSEKEFLEVLSSSILTMTDVIKNNSFYIKNNYRDSIQTIIKNGKFNFK